MKKIYYPEKINFSDYQYEINNPKVFYGLNSQVKFCKKCSMVNQMPISTVEFNHTIEEKKNRNEYKSRSNLRSLYT